VNPPPEAVRQKFSPAPPSFVFDPFQCLGRSIPQSFCSNLLPLPPPLSFTREDVPPFFLLSAYRATDDPTPPNPEYFFPVFHDFSPFPFFLSFFSSAFFRPCRMSFHPVIPHSFFFPRGDFYSHSLPFVPRPRPPLFFTVCHKPFPPPPSGNPSERFFSQSSRFQRHRAGLFFLFFPPSFVSFFFFPIFPPMPMSSHVPLRFEQ